MTSCPSSPDPVFIPIAGDGKFPVRRIYCVGRNYADHVTEMGGDPKSSAPLFFTKSRETVVKNGREIPFPTMTNNLHYEGELVAAIGADGGVFGYACGLDMTRRDLQAAAKAKGKAWDMAKNFDHSAPIGALTRVSDFSLRDAKLQTMLNGETVQEAPLADMIWSVAEIIQTLSDYVTLYPGDIIMTGTPAGVGRVKSGDTVKIAITGLETLTIRYA
ncbi:fumarylacetoacetate hydrolase family protein [Robiginitomaculum antarcticum]|uniref:fumarylacetoacetate hydrolase family protein n=1 Tax=Robiginitomaculum antarcticum TaxID=437507 RepID=UPI00037A611E|nr:fumarylacetoacetate hydrolase family protein [Robiginitomaculum antarcticum]